MKYWRRRVSKGKKQSEMEEKRNKKEGNNEWMKRCGLLEVKRDDWRESFCHSPGSTYQRSLYLNRSLHFPFAFTHFVSQEISSTGRHKTSLETHT